VFKRNEKFEAFHKEENMYFFIILSINEVNFVFILKFSNSRYFLSLELVFIDVGVKVSSLSYSSNKKVAESPTKNQTGDVRRT
jgi:hypothetical protein